MTTKRPKTPSDLGASGRQLWRTVLTGWALDDRELLVLANAARLADRAQNCRQALETDGLQVPGTNGQPRPHPLIAVERESMLAAGRLLASIGVKSSQERQGGRFTSPSGRPLTRVV